MRTSSRIILDPHDVVFPLGLPMEINDPQTPLVSPAYEAVYYPARIVSSARSTERERQVAQGSFFVEMRMVDLDRMSDTLRQV